MLTSIFLFILRMVLQIMIYPFALRFLFRWHQVDYFNPLTQSMMRITEKPLKLVSFLVKATHTFDIPALLVTFLLSMGVMTIKIHALGFLVTFPNLLLAGFVDLLKIFCFLYMLSSIIYAVSGFFGVYNANTKVFSQIVSSQLDKIRKVLSIRTRSSIDISFFLWWIILLSINFILNLLSNGF